MSEAKLVFITGPSGAGKSTTAKEVATKWPTMCALLDFDKIRTLIKSGYAEPAIGWNDETERQWELTKQIVMAMAKAYTDNGVSVVLEVFATPHDYPKWKELFGDIPYKSFALLPDLDVVVARNNQREGTPKLKESDITRNYDWSIDWKSTEDIIVLNNGARSAADISVDIIEKS